jgi:hypothetical protein
MKHSDDYDSLIEALFEGRADTEEATRLLGDAAGDELEELSELVDTLARIDPGLTPGIALPSDGEFRAARQNVLARIAAEAAPAPRRGHYWLPLAAALAAFAIGLAIGKGNSAPAPTPLPQTLADLVGRSALTTTPDSGFRYSNLRLREVDADTLALSVDVENTLELVRPKNDALVSDILAESLAGEGDLGERLKAVRYAGHSPRIRRAMIAAALHDPSLSVRLKALERLIEQDATAPETQEALLAIVESDSEVGMRLLALDALSDDYMPADLLDSLGGSPAGEGESAVLWRAQQRINGRSL